MITKRPMLADLVKMRASESAWRPVDRLVLDELIALRELEILNMPDEVLLAYCDVKVIRRGFLGFVRQVRVTHRASGLYVDSISATAGLSLLRQMILDRARRGDPQVPTVVRARPGMAV